MKERFEKKMPHHITEKKRRKQCGKLLDIHKKFLFIFLKSEVRLRFEGKSN